MTHWEHDSLAEDLARHVAHEARMVWTNMQLGPAGSARPDVYTIRKSYTRPTPIAYEVKVQRADFLQDVRSEKWRRYLRHACAVYFAFPRGLADPAEVPKECGVMLRSEKGWWSARSPFFLGQGQFEFTQFAMMKLLIDGVDRVHCNGGGVSEWYVKKLEERLRVARATVRSVNKEVAMYKRWRQLDERRRWQEYKTKIKEP